MDCLVRRKVGCISRELEKLTDIRVSSQIRISLIFLLKISLFPGSGEAFCIFYKEFRRDPENNDFLEKM